MWTQDNDCDIRTESGDRLSRRSHAGDGEVLLEVKIRKWFMLKSPKQSPPQSVRTWTNSHEFPELTY